MLGVLLSVLPWVVLGDPGDQANFFLSLMEKKERNKEAHTMASFHTFSQIYRVPRLRPP